MSRPDLNPQPCAWPQCSDCKTAYVLRRVLVFGHRATRLHIRNEWVWQRDCKHRKAAPEMGGTAKKRGRKGRKP